MTRPSLESKRHHTFGLHRSRSHLSSKPSSPHLFEGTDAVLQKRKVALRNVIQTHHALERKYGHVATPTSTSSERPTSSSSSISYDPFTTDFGDLSMPDAEVRTFRYLLHRWEPKNLEWADPEFEKVIERRRESFEEAAIKHFISRVALWDASGQEQQTQSRSVFSIFGRRRRSRAKSDASRMLSIAETTKEDPDLDALKEVTTREGLAQLLSTLLKDDGPATARLREECKQAMHEWYQTKFITDGSTDS
ncbi:uncharacterized protein J4E79_001795 [Alternaria viburni]|uniref:uncharacterized protein n=1 Tax=Alternaria viburni TaxID=566460 RepID=UPI0020C45B3C|nr:uncharacterized protein J4E79_001795 [Alternaria viburni]KAI4667111.1 hypothetical protein J4E79_001795 [Alternaria viburni]